MRPKQAYDAIQGPRRAPALTDVTLGLQWLMEPFFWLQVGKICGSSPPERLLLA